MTTAESEAPVVKSVGWSFVKVERRYHDTHEGKMVTVATVYKGNEAIARCHKVENAALIIKAVNRDHLLDEMRRALEGMVRLSEMGFEESMKEPEENGNYAAFTRAHLILSKLRALDAREE